MSRVFVVLVVALCFLLLAAPAQAQFAMGADGGYYTLSGDDFQDTDAGFGFGGFLRYVLAAGIRFGGGVHLGSHDVAGFDTNFNVFGVYIEPGYQFNIPNAPMLKPFLAARGYWMRYKMSEVGGAITATGSAFGGVAGVLFQVVPQFGIEPSVAYYRLSFGDAKFEGETFLRSDRSGGSLGFKLAFVVTVIPSR